MSRNGVELDKDRNVKSLNKNWICTKSVQHRVAKTKATKIKRNKNFREEKFEGTKVLGVEKISNYEMFEKYFNDIIT